MSLNRAGLSSGQALRAPTEGAFEILPQRFVKITDQFVNRVLARSKWLPFALVNFKLHSDLTIISKGNSTVNLFRRVIILVIHLTRILSLSLSLSNGASFMCACVGNALITIGRKVLRADI